MSMTGFGKITESLENKKITIEIRSLNSKSLDLTTRIPQEYRELEAEIRSIISTGLDRGKIDFSISAEQNGVAKQITINKRLALSYIKDLTELQQLAGLPQSDLLSIITKLPDVFISEKADLNASEKSFVLQLTKQAIDQLNGFRRQEGVALERDFMEQIQLIQANLEKVPAFEQERISTIKERIKRNLEELDTAVNYDSNRLEQELIFYMEKLDVSEEKMRLQNHLSYFLETMKSEKSGKKLGFIAQEIGREINTLGSKSNHVEMQKLVVNMKDSLEKIKEQVLNTL